MRIVSLDNSICESRPIKNKKDINVILPSGIGDNIYAWTKLIHFVKMGHEVNVAVSDSHPQRAHQILGCLEGMKSFSYVKDFDLQKYWLKQVLDPRNPPADAIFNNFIVLHINSFLETNQHIDSIMPDFPADYDIKLRTPGTSKEWAENFLSTEQFNLILYCSNYENNRNCNVHPESKFWTELVELCIEWKSLGRSTKVIIVGAEYDRDLSQDVFLELLRKKVNVELLIDEPFYNVIELVRMADFLITYESGFGMVGDVVKTDCLEIFRKQGGTRDDKMFPFLGPINPAGIWKRFYPFFYDDGIKEIGERINSL